MTIGSVTWEPDNFDFDDELGPAPRHAKLHTLKVGARFQVVGLEEDGVLELLRVSQLSAYVRPTVKVLREFDARMDSVSFESPSNGYNISPNTIVVEVP